MGEKNFMNIFNNPTFWGAFGAVSFWILVILFGFLFFANRSRPHLFTLSLADKNLTTEIVEHKGTVDWSQLEVDSLNVVHLAQEMDSASYYALRNKILREEMKVGRLMTAEQMSDNITGYYDKLIDVLIALFIIFSIVSYFVINNKFAKKYEDDKEKMMDKIQESLMNSQSLHSSLVDGISTKLNKSLVKEENIKEIWEKLKDNDEYIDLLVSVCDDLTETAAMKTVIEDDNEEKPEEA